MQVVVIKKQLKQIDLIIFLIYYYIYIYEIKHFNIGFL